MTSIGTWVLHATSDNVEVQHVWTLISNILGWGGRNVSTQFRNLQVHMAKVFREQFLLQDSSISVTLMNITGDILCCYQTQSETLQDFEMELVNWKKPMLHHSSTSTPKQRHVMNWICQTGQSGDLDEEVSWYRKVSWRDSLAINFCELQRPGKFQGNNARALVKGLPLMELKPIQKAIVYLLRFLVISLRWASIGNAAEFWSWIEDVQTLLLPALDGYCSCSSHLHDFTWCLSHFPPKKRGM